MKIVVLEQEVVNLGGTIPEGDVFLQRAKQEMERLEQLTDAVEQAEIAKREALEA